jgi:hypothetical protein
MLRLIIFKFWPALIPAIIYLVWLLIARKKAKKLGAQVLPGIKDGPWIEAVISTIAIVIAMFFWLALSTPVEKGQYIPPKVVNGKIIDSQIIDQVIQNQD